MTLFRIS